MANASALRLNRFENIPEHIARHIIEQFEESLPQLNHLAVFLPNNNSSQHFRRQLLASLPESAPRALFPPWLGTLEHWAFDTLPPPDPELTHISEEARQIVFIDALLQHPGLFKDDNKWQVTDNLLTLFNELNLQQADIAKSSKDWLETLQSAYGLESSHQHLEQEASLVHRLWYAWHEQLQANKLQDHSSAYLSRLQFALKNLPDDFYCYAVLPERYSRAESDFISALHQQNRCTIVEYIADDVCEYTESQRFFNRLLLTAPHR